MKLKVVALARAAGVDAPVAFAEESHVVPEIAAIEPENPEPETGEPECSGPEAASYENLVDLVERIHNGTTDGMEELYRMFSKGVRFYLCRQLGPQEIDDKVHDTFLVVVQAIRKGELREPERLMGFVRTIVRRQVAAHIDRAVAFRRDHVDAEASFRVADPHENPEDCAIFRERTVLLRRVLEELLPRDAEILTRFYLYEQSQDLICSQMGLATPSSVYSSRGPRPDSGNLARKSSRSGASAQFS
jgi:RNA polymerase sigma factor (sigma-70 family)